MLLWLAVGPSDRSSGLQGVGCDRQVALPSEALSLLLCSDLCMIPSPSPDTHTHTQTLAGNLELRLTSMSCMGTLPQSQAQGGREQEAAQMERRHSEGKGQRLWFGEDGQCPHGSRLSARWFPLHPHDPCPALFILSTSNPLEEEGVHGISCFLQGRPCLLCSYLFSSSLCPMWVHGQGLSVHLS